MTSGFVAPAVVVGFSSAFVVVVVVVCMAAINTLPFEAVDDDDSDPDATAVAVAATTEGIPPLLAPLVAVIAADPAATLVRECWKLHSDGVAGAEVCCSCCWICLRRSVMGNLLRVHVRSSSRVLKRGRIAGSARWSKGGDDAVEDAAEGSGGLLRAGFGLLCRWCGELRRISLVVLCLCWGI